MPFDSTTTANPAVETPEAALAFLEEGPHRWCQGALWRDRGGYPLRDSSYKLAYSVCSVGAINVCRPAGLLRQHRHGCLCRHASGNGVHNYRELQRRADHHLRNGPGCLPPRH
jgi:hypothetical protein